MQRKNQTSLGKNLRLKSIKMLVMDFDGVFTDNGVYTDEDGREIIKTNKFDSLGIKMLKTERPDISMLVITKEKSMVTKARCRKLGLECIVGVDDKLSRLRGILSERNISIDDVAYIGNDTIDADCLYSVGIGIAVADSSRDALLAADYMTNKKGGEGAIREIIDLILE